MANINVLTVDDDSNIGHLLSLYLKKEGYDVDVATDGESAIAKIKEKDTKYDIILLDVMMPVMDGLETLREIRKFCNTPVILLTAKSEAMDKIVGLDLGADDYVTKPFEAQELISRIKAILRRLQTEQEGNTDLTIDNLFLSIGNYVVKLNGVKVEMPPKEIELLYYLSTHQLKVYTREQLLYQIWGLDYKGDPRTVDVHIKRIREKLGEANTWKIKTVWGIGYKFEVD
jgi:DNA-binding response OmpR family regulator